jgi:hypothetical protein
MNDQHDGADHEKKVNQSARDMKSQPRDDPNGEEDETQR